MTCTDQIIVTPPSKQFVLIESMKFREILAFHSQQYFHFGKLGLGFTNSIFIRIELFHCHSHLGIPPIRNGRMVRNSVNRGSTLKCMTDIVHCISLGMFAAECVRVMIGDFHCCCG